MAYVVKKGVRVLTWVVYRHYTGEEAGPSPAPQRPPPSSKCQVIVGTGSIGHLSSESEPSHFKKAVVGTRFNTLQLSQH